MSGTGRYLGLIWDVDGTLADTLQLSVEAFLYTFAKFDAPPLTVEEVTALYGPTEEGVLRRVLGERWPEATDVFIEEYQRRHVTDAIGFVGLREVMQRLAAAGVPMAVVTGKGPRSVRITLQKLGFAAYFDPVHTGDIGGPVKRHRIAETVNDWDLEPARIAYIGDAASDISDARAVGVAAIAAAWKPIGDVSRLLAAEPDEVLMDIPSLSAWVQAHVLQ